MTKAPIEVSTNANVSEIDKENEDFHSEDEMDISQNDSALDNQLAGLKFQPRVELSPGLKISSCNHFNIGLKFS